MALQHLYAADFCVWGGGAGGDARDLFLHYWVFAGTCRSWGNLLPFCRNLITGVSINSGINAVEFQFEFEFELERESIFKFEFSGLFTGDCSDEFSSEPVEFSGNFAYESSYASLHLPRQSKDRSFCH